MRKVTPQEAVWMVNALMTGWQFLELMDKIIDTTLYKHELKLRINQIMPELEKFVDHLHVFFGVDVAGMNNMMEHKRALSLKLISLRPEIHSGLNELLDSYFANPEKVLKEVGIVTIESNSKREIEKKSII